MTEHNKSELWNAGQFLLRLAFNHDEAIRQGLDTTAFESLLQEVEPLLADISKEQMSAIKTDTAQAMKIWLSSLHELTRKGKLSEDELRQEIVSKCPFLNAGQIEMLLQYKPQKAEGKHSHGVVEHIAPIFGVTPETIFTWIRESKGTKKFRHSLHLDHTWDNSVEVEFLTQALSVVGSVPAQKAAVAISWLNEHE